MLRPFLSVMLLLAMSSLALGDYLLFKIDLNQVPFSSLGEKAGGGAAGGQPGAGGKGGGFPMPMVQPMGPKGAGDPGLPAGNANLVVTDDPGNWVYGVFEFNKKSMPIPVAQHKIIVVPQHKWGKSMHLSMQPYVEFKHLRRDSALEEYRIYRKKTWGSGKDVDSLLRIATTALTHNLPKEFHAIMAEIKKIDPKRQAVVNYERVTAELKKAPPGDEPGSLPAELKSQGYLTSPSSEGHYVVYHKDSPEFADPAAIKRRKARLEETYANFFYWFALQEKMDVPPMPAYRLPVLLETSADFVKRQKECNKADQLTDGFTLRRENLIVLSSKPADENFMLLEKNLQPVRQSLGVFPDELIKGSVWNKDEAKKNFQSVSVVQMLTLVQKIMEDEAELAAINREGVSQLLGATGMLARNIVAPEWMQAGVTSYFESPPGSLHPNFGLPSTTNLVAFKTLYKSGKLGKGADLLVNLATDRYFRQAARDLEKLREADKRDVGKKERDQLVQNLRESTEMAHSTAWSLVYYLSLQRKSHHLLRYAQQLNALPRHMELNEQALQACFARAFDMEDARDPRKIDVAKAQAFARTWCQDMEGISLEYPEVEAFHSDPRLTPAASPTGK